MKKFILFIFSLLVFETGLAQKYLNQNFYDFYSEFIDNEVNKRILIRGEKVKSVVLAREISPSGDIYSHIKTFNFRRYNEIIQKDSAWHDIILSISAENDENIKLDYNFSTATSLIIESKENLESLLRINNKNGWKWKRFYKKYPESFGWISISNIHFNANGTKAGFYSEQRIHSLNSAGTIYFYEKINGKWVEISSFDIWMS